MGTTEPTQSEKFLWIGLSRNLEDIDSDDLPDDTIRLENLEATVNTVDPLIFHSTLTVDADNILDDDAVAETFAVEVDGSVQTTQVEGFEPGESRTIEMEFRYTSYGTQTVRVTAGEDEAEQEVFVSPFYTPDAEDQDEEDDDSDSRDIGLGL